MTEDGLEDALDLDNPYYQKLSSLYGMGSKDEWAIIDLKALREGYYYHPQKYKLNILEEKLAQRFDILIVTPTEVPGTNNY